MLIYVKINLLWHDTEEDSKEHAAASKKGVAAVAGITMFHVVEYACNGMCNSDIPRQ